MQITRRKLGEYLDRKAFRAAPHRRARTRLVDCYFCGVQAGHCCVDFMGNPYSEERWPHGSRVELADLAAVMECIDYPEFQEQSRPDDVIDVTSPPVTEAQSFLAAKHRYLFDVAGLSLARMAMWSPEFKETEGL